MTFSRWKIIGPAVVAAQKARDLAAQTLDAEQKKYNLGASTYLAVLQDERDLAQAESTLVSAMTNYAKARVQLDRDTAQTLDRYNIKIDEAVTGKSKPSLMFPASCPTRLLSRNPPLRHSNRQNNSSFFQIPPADLRASRFFIFADIGSVALSLFSVPLCLRGRFFSSAFIRANLRPSLVFPF